MKYGPESNQYNNFISCKSSLIFLDSEVDPHHNNNPLHAVEHGVEGLDAFGLGLEV
jgi:hypothetical protein